ncbi:hypothetical protein EsH8_VII_000452 [Colletotrichum jinshuiense]
MRHSSPSGRSQRQSQTTVGIALVILALLTVFAVSQAAQPIQDGHHFDRLAKRNAGLEARQIFGLPWGLFGGSQPTSSASPAQPVISTPLPAAAPATPNNQQQGPLGGVIGQIIPPSIVQVVAPLTQVLGGVGAPAASVVGFGNVVSSVAKVVPVVAQSLLQPGNTPSIPAGTQNGQGPQSVVVGGLLSPVQSLVHSIIGVGGNAGSIAPTAVISILPAAGVPGSPSSPTPQVGGGLPLHLPDVTPALGNGISVITNIPTELAGVIASAINKAPSVANGLPSAVDAIAATLANPLPSLVPIAISVPPINPVMSNLDDILQSVSVVLPLSSTIPVNLGGLSAPQLPGDLTGAVPSLLGSIASAVGQVTAPISGGAVASQASDLAFEGKLCTVVKIANDTPTFLAVPCSITPSPAAPRTTSAAALPVSNPAVPSGMPTTLQAKVDLETKATTANRKVRF